MRAVIPLFPELEILGLYSLQWSIPQPNLLLIFAEFHYRREFHNFGENGREGRGVKSPSLHP
jgi:hypothetical protein